MSISCTYQYHLGRSLARRLHTLPHTNPRSVKIPVSQKAKIKLNMQSISVQLWHKLFLLPWWLASCDCLLYYNLAFLFALLGILLKLMMKTKISYRYWSVASSLRCYYRELHGGMSDLRSSSGRRNHSGHMISGCCRQWHTPGTAGDIQHCVSLQVVIVLCGNLLIW